MKRRRRAFHPIRLIPFTGKYDTQPMNLSQQDTILIPMILSVKPFELYKEKSTCK